MSWMHVYAQGFWHEPVLIAGDRDALTGLRAVIDAALVKSVEGYRKRAGSSMRRNSMATSHRARRYPPTND